jgi:Phosphotransferase enzyme family
MGHSRRERAVLDTEGHPAFRAWRELTPHSPLPLVIESLQHKRRSQVYRLRWPGNGSSSSIIAKRCRTHMSVVERAAYRTALPTAQVRVPAYYGYLDDASANSDDPFAWIFIEDMGSRRFSPVDAGERLRLAQWLGSLQATLLQPEAPNSNELPVRDAAYYQRFLQQAIEDVPSLAAERSSPGTIPALIGTVQSALWCVQARWDEVAATFASVPMTLVHGDCLPKNIHVAHDKNGREVVPIDWGNAGWGLPASDLGQSALLLAEATVTNACYDSYAAALRPAWPACSTSTVQRLANLGRLLWSIKVIAMSVPGFRYDSTVKVEHNLSIYSSILLTSLRMANWTAAH